VSRGLAGVAFTDHCDVDAGRDACFGVINGLKSEVASLREAFDGILEISVGCELGEPHHDVPLSREILADGDIDFVIGSLHRRRGDLDYHDIDYDRADIDAMMRGYYEELLELAESGCYDVLGHINYQERYMSESARCRLDLSSYGGEVLEILKVVASAGKGIEVNSSGLGRGLGHPLPDADVLEAFRRVGGEVLTIGSDAHIAARVGGELDGAVKFLKGAGFGRFAFFKGRKPSFHDV
jgi:histidinol-phosphatase (PHP family)